MNIRIHNGLPYISVILGAGDQSIQLPNVLLDTGSGATLFSTDHLSEIGLLPRDTDTVERVFGVGGSEIVFTKNLEWLQIGNFRLNDLQIQGGALNYGLELDGILGMNVLLLAKGIVDFRQFLLSLLNEQKI